jgi:hypothetical protein
MTQKKITKRESFTEIKEILEGLGKDSLAEVMEHELELLAKKNSADKKPTATQVENEKFKELIVEFMEEGEKYTITEMLKMFPCCAELTNQKVSAAMRSLIESGEVERTESKGKAYFELATPSPEEEE